MGATVESIETAIDQLSLGELFPLMEHLMGRIRSRTLPRADMGEDDLAEMARDPMIQQELRQTAIEFAATEADGLDSA